MIDDELLGEIRDSVANGPMLEQLTASEATELLDAIAARYVGDRDRIWWWESLTGPHEEISYGNGDGLAAVARIVPAQSPAFLVVTDDEPPPWPVFKGTAADALSALRKVRFCEYFLADRGLSWVVFDTHHNMLVIAGTSIGARQRVDR